MVSRPTVISTFAGCGGSSLGYKLAGFKELLAVEIDQNAADTLRLNFPDVQIFLGDIANLSVLNCMKIAGVRTGELDVLDGSPPCQGFSTAGKRKYNDPRNSLFKEYCRLLKGLQPKVFIMENVTGLTKGVMKQAYLKIIKELRDCNYEVKAQILNAAYFDVPQKRERVIFIGVRRDLKKKPSLPSPQTEPRTVRQALKNCPLEEVPNISKRWKDIIYKIKPGECAEDVSKGGGFQSCVRLHWDRPSPTLPKIVGGIGYGSLLHPKEDRVLSIAEMKRLQTFPDDFKFLGKYVDARARIGNSVPPNLMKAIALHVKENFLSSDQEGSRNA